MSMAYCRCGALIDTDEDPEACMPAGNYLCEPCREWTLDDVRQSEADDRLADMRAEGLI